jgi:hypothetical protein
MKPAPDSSLPSYCLKAKQKLKQSNNNHQHNNNNKSKQVSKEYPNHEQKYSDMNRHRPQGNE